MIQLNAFTEHLIISAGQKVAGVVSFCAYFLLVFNQSEIGLA